VDFRIRSWHQTTKFGVAHEQHTAPKDSKNEQIKSQNHANLFFSTVKALFIRNSCLKDKQLINSTIVRSLNDSEKGFIVSGQRLRTLGCYITTMLPVTLPSPWTNFWPKKYFSGSTATILAWSESVWLLPFPKTQIPPQMSSFWNCGQHPKGRDRPAEGTTTWRLPALLPGVGATFPAVCDFPRELLWRG